MTRQMPAHVVAHSCRRFRRLLRPTSLVGRLEIIHSTYASSRIAAGNLYPCRPAQVRSKVFGWLSPCATETIIHMFGRHYACAMLDRRHCITDVDWTRHAARVLRSLACLSAWRSGSNTLVIRYPVDHATCHRGSRVKYSRSADRTWSFLFFFFF
jgi:hypothetical protein